MTQLAASVDPNATSSSLYSLWKSAIRIVDDSSPVAPNLIAAGLVGATVGAAYLSGLKPNVWEYGPDIAVHLATATIALLPATKQRYNAGEMMNCARAAHIMYKWVVGSNFPPAINLGDFLFHFYNARHFLIHSPEKPKKA